MISRHKIMRAWFSLLVAFLWATGAFAQTTNGLSDAEVQGQKLVQDILQETPTENVKQTGILIVKDSKGNKTSAAVTFSTVINNGYWEADYLAEPTNRYGAYRYGAQIILEIIHGKYPSNQYLYSEVKGSPAPIKDFWDEMDPIKTLQGAQIMAPFADSDFWFADLGLEFFHWPEQKVLKHESRRTRDCTVLESTNPNPTPGSYSRVVTWIDNESHTIVYAEAYDVNNKLLKEFNPKKIKKVNGQWQLEEMDIRNVQTKSRTWITFDLSGKS